MVFVFGSSKTKHCFFYDVDKFAKWKLKLLRPFALGAFHNSKTVFFPNEATKSAKSVTLV